MQCGGQNNYIDLAGSLLTVLRAIWLTLQVVQVVDEVLKDKGQTKQPNNGKNHNFQRFFFHTWVAHHKRHSYGKCYLEAVKKYGNDSEYNKSPHFFTLRLACDINLVDQGHYEAENYEGNQGQVGLELELANQFLHLFPILFIAQHLELLLEGQVLGRLTFFWNPKGQLSVAHNFEKPVQVKHHEGAFNYPFVVEFPGCSCVLLGGELFYSQGHSKTCGGKHGNEADLVAKIEVKFKLPKCEVQ